MDDLLAVPGFTKEIVDKLRDFVVVLPGKTAVNANTASAEVLAAHIENFSMGEANALVGAAQARRLSRPWQLDLYLHGKHVDGGGQGGVCQRDYFLVHSRIRLDRAALDAESLIEAKQAAPATVLWVRQN